MAIGVDVIKTSGRLIFELERGEEKTTRSIDMAYPRTDSENLQQTVNTANATFTDATNSMNLFIQPANWRDAPSGSSSAEPQWTTTRVRYEIVTTATTPIDPDEV